MLDKIEKGVAYFSHECIRENCLSTFIADTDFDLQNMRDENRSFILELQRIHFEQLASTIIS